MRRALFTAVLLAAAGAALWWYLRPQPVSVTLVNAELGPVAATVANTRAGTVDACRRAGLSPPTGGQIASLPVKDGDRVEQNSILLELWNDDLKAEFELAQRDAQAARSRSRESCVIAAVAAREAARMMRLFEQELVSEEAAERAVGEQESRAAACTAAQDQTRVNEARIDVVSAQLERTRLRAPFAGIIAEINGELGEFVTPSPVGIPTPPTVDLIDATCLYISAPIDEVDAPRIAAGLPARISLDAFPDRVFPGEVRRVAPYVLDQERQARTVEIEANIYNAAEAGLLPGYSADVEVVLESHDRTLRVPTSVILSEGFVFVYDEARGIVERRNVELGISNWEFTEILAGLSEGDRVVSSIDREGVVDGALAEPE